VPAAAPVACPPYPINVVTRAVQEEVTALAPVLTGYLDQLVPAQVTAVQTVLDELAYPCSTTRTAAIIGAATTR